MENISRESLQSYKTIDELKGAAYSCHACGLRETCTQVVFGDGDGCADLMMIGEAPGKQEDQQGQPFVGAAGQLLDKILQAADIDRRQIYITNTVKCRPPENRMPTNNERDSCFPWLIQQVRLIQPTLIVCLGAMAAQTVLGPDIRITRDRGKVFRRKDKIIIPTYHPAALLRDPGKKKDAWLDFQCIRDYYYKLHECDDTKPRSGRKSNDG